MVDTDYFLDAPACFLQRQSPAPATGVGTWADGVALPLGQRENVHARREYQRGCAQGPALVCGEVGRLQGQRTATIVPDLASEWDENGDGVPDNYYLVTNALTLQEQL